jgi:hypothetical protein
MAKREPSRAIAGGPSRNPTGLVEALADLLLEALGVESLTTTGGGDEHQDHA